MTNESRVINIKQTAEYINVSVRTLYRMNSRDLRAMGMIEIGKTKKFDKRKLDMFLDQLSGVEND